METARQRLSVADGISEADLRRATSDLYYALFHRVCEALLEPIGTQPESQAFKETYVTLYRLPEHQYLEKRCKEIDQHEFSEPVSAFAQQIIAFKNKRQNADYHPLTRFSRSAVQNDITIIEAAIKNFNEVEQTERTRFAYFVAIKSNRKSA